ncbi:hypothetical protein ACG873_09750 [Mesorhizobium sp. AaZ16]|uniref:hypothetical protein n=1 Tax=Mesorhizobium sp. AaZ16 TaxID=3402289 RepID=UPI00374F835D
MQIKKIKDFRRNLERRFIHTSPLLAHNLLTVLTGPGAHRVSGRTAVTSRRGFGIHVSEGVRRAGIPSEASRLRERKADHPRVIVHGKNMERGA